MKYSPELTEEIATRVREGSSQRDAAILSGITEKTFYVWMKEKSAFCESLEKAELECKNRNIKIIQKAAITTWQAAAWWMERRYSSDYALKWKNEFSGKDGQPLHIALVAFAPKPETVWRKSDSNSPLPV